MILGRACQITIGTSNVQESYECYKHLGFRKLAEDLRPFPWIKMTDDSIVILLYQNGDLYLSLTYFDKEMPKITKKLMEQGVNFVQRTTNEHIFVTPTDTVIVLVDANHEGMVNPLNKMLLDLPESDFFNEDRYPNKRLGIFGELSHAVLDIEAAINYWLKLGFRLHHRADEPYPWALLYDGYMNIGLHETNDFDGPVLTYFVPDVKSKVEQLNQAGIYGITEYRGAGGDGNNVVIRTPENQQFFLFQS